MVEIGDIVVLKSGGPDMSVTYVLKGGEGAREKAAAMKGFGKGDVVVEYQETDVNGNTRRVVQSFKAATLVDVNGNPLVGGGGGKKKKDDDDDDW
jgi:hypothetical protein